jgi:hypothetical protein
VLRYDAYCVELERLCELGKWPWTRTRVVRMQKYAGFGFSLKMGLSVKEYCVVFRFMFVLWF